MNLELMELQRVIDRDFGIYQSKFKDLEEAQKRYRELQVEQDSLSLTMAYFNKLVDSKRKEIMDKIIGLVTYGLQSVFEDPTMKLIVKERIQRNQKFYTLAVSIDGVETEDWENSSGGIVDVLNFMLRVVLLSVSSNRKFLALDEPFKGLSKNYRERLGDFLKLLADELNMQFLIVSHQAEIDSAADMLYEIRKVDGEVKILRVSETSNG